MLAWEGAECPYVTDECLQLPVSAELPPRDMPLAIELVSNSTVFSYADLQNFDTSKIFVQNQNSEWGTQVRQGELVRYQVKAAGSNVADATVVIRDSVGLPSTNWKPTPSASPTSCRCPATSSSTETGTTSSATRRLTFRERQS